MAKTKKVQGFHTNLLSLNQHGIEARATYIFLILIMIVAVNSIRLLGSGNLIQMLGLGLTLTITFTIGFVVYDALYNALVRKLPMSYNFDRLVLFGSQLILVGLVISPIVVGWLAGSGAILNNSLLLGELWVSIFAVILLIFRVFGGFFQLSLAKSSKPKRKKR